ATAFHELTVRLRDDDGRLVAPGEFIPAAERYNVMSVIDRWVVQRAIERLRDWVERAEGSAAVEGQWHGSAVRAVPAPPARDRSGLQLPLLAVNLSGTSLNEQSFID